MLYLSLRQLEYAVAVAEAGSLTLAAQQLNVSQPAISVAISQVEARLGQRLFCRRKGAPVVATAFGRLFLADAAALLAEATRLEDPAAMAGRRLTQVRLGIFEDLAPRWLAPLLGRLRVGFPEVTVRPLVARFEELAEAVLAGRIELALTYDLGLDASFRRELFRRVAPQAWVAPGDPLAERAGVELAELATRPLILSDQGLSIRHMLGLFRGLGLVPRVAHRAASVEVLRSLAAHGEGVGISYADPAGELSHDGRPVRRVPILDAAAAEPIVLVSAGQLPELLPEPLPEPLPAIRAAILAAGRQAGG